MRQLSLAAAAILLLGAGFQVAQLYNPLETKPKPNMVVMFDSSVTLEMDTKCGGCHGMLGQGLEYFGPPLARNPFVIGDPVRVIRVVLDGTPRTQSLGAPNTRTRPGQHYRAPMPPFRGRLSNAQIATIVSYVRNSWGNRAPVVYAQDVARVAGQNPH